MQPDAYPPPHLAPLEELQPEVPPITDVDAAVAYLLQLAEQDEAE